MEYTLRFDMTTPEGRNGFKHASCANAYWMILWEMDQWLREQHKYNNKVWAGVARERLSELCRDGNVNLWDE